MAGLYDDVVGGEYKGTSKWKRPQQAYGSMGSFGGNPWASVAATRNPRGGSTSQAGYGGYVAGRNPWGGATGVGGYGGYAPSQASGQQSPASTSNPWTWNQKGPEQYNAEAARRQAELGAMGAGGRSAADLAEYKYLAGLKAQGQSPNPKPNGYNPSIGGQVIDPITGKMMSLTQEQYMSRQDPNYSSNRMNTLFQQLPQFQQYISQLGGMPGQPDNNERWKYFLERVMQGSDPMAVMNSERFWGGV